MAVYRSISWWRRGRTGKSCSWDSFFNGFSQFVKPLSICQVPMLLYLLIWRAVFHPDTNEGSWDGRGCARPLSDSLPNLPLPQTLKVSSQSELENLFFSLNPVPGLLHPFPKCSRDKRKHSFLEERIYLWRMNFAVFERDHFVSRRCLTPRLPSIFCSQWDSLVSASCWTRTLEFHRAS